MSHTRNRGSIAKVTYFPEGCIGIVHDTDLYKYHKLHVFGYMAIGQFFRMLVI